MSDAAQVHEFDQAEKAAEFEAKVLSKFYTTLVVGGIPPEVALEMTVSRFQADLWNGQRCCCEDD